MRLLFINAHADDVEFCAASTCKQAVDLGWEVHEILMTSDEYSVQNEDFKGKRIKRIRMNEMEQAAKEYGVKENGSSKIQIYWFGEIDVYLPFNREIFLELKRVVNQIDPDIIIGPDSFFSMDYHPDHLNTGYLVYYVTREIFHESIKKQQKKRPLLLLYHSFNTNFYVKIKDLSIQVDAWAKHRSQTKPFMNYWLRRLRKFFYFYRRIKTGSGIGEGFRRVDFSSNENIITSFKHKIIHYFFASGIYPPYKFQKKWGNPSPEKLGLSSRFGLRNNTTRENI